jgi:hypothetical protein
MLFSACELSCYIRSFEDYWSFTVPNNSHLTLLTVTTNKLFKLVKDVKYFDIKGNLIKVTLTRMTGLCCLYPFFLVAVH